MPRLRGAPCATCGVQCRTGTRPGEVIFVETPFGATLLRELLSADGGSYRLRAVVCEASPGHAVARIASPQSPGAFSLLDDGAVVISAPAPAPHTVRLMAFARALGEGDAPATASVAEQPALREFKVRPPLGARGPRLSWAFVALLAAAARRPGHDSSRCVDTVGVPLFAAAVAELRAHLPPESAWRVEAGAPYADATAQEAAINAATLANPSGPTARCLELLRAQPARPAQRLVDPVAPAAGDRVAADLSGSNFVVLSVGGGFASLQGAGGEIFNDVPVSTLAVVQRAPRQARAAAPSPGHFAASAAAAPRAAHSESDPSDEENAAEEAPSSAAQSSDDDGGSDDSERAVVRPARRATAPRAEAPACTCGRDRRRQGRHARHCAVTVFNARARVAAAMGQGNLLPRDVFPDAPAHTHQSATPEQDEDEDPGDSPPPPPVPPPSFEEVAAFNPPLLDRIPRRVRQAVAHAFARTAAAANSHDSLAWLRLCAFAKVILRKPSAGESSPYTSVPSRCRRWLARGFAYFGALWAEAVAKTRPPSDLPPGFFPVVDRPRLAVGPPLLDTEVSEASLPDAAVHRATVQAERGFFARAVAALAAAALAPPTAENFDRLAALHPAAPPPEHPQHEQDEAPAFSERQVRNALRAFKLGSGAGLTGLAPQHLVDMCSFPGSPALASITRLVSLTAAGLVPSPACPLIFGARLVALQKADGGVRPIACGDVLRRMAARLLAAKASHKLARYLLEKRQVGVRTPSGAEAAQLAARRFAAAMSPDMVLVKLDFRNAFNTVSRQAFVDEVARLAPEIFPHVWAAYSRPSSLYFSGRRLSSEAGAQQGDPLGPLLFSLAAAAVRDKVFETLSPEDRAEVRFEAAFLDDVSFGAPAPVARRLLDAFASVSLSAGLGLNLRKTEVVFHPDAPDDARALFPDVGSSSSSLSFCLLGAPCGSSLAAAAAYVKDACVLQARKIRLISKIPVPQIAFALLRFCGAQPLGNYFARAVGPIGAEGFELLDAAAAATFDAAVFPLPPACVELASLPPRLGGLGLRRVSSIAVLAFAAACAAARPLADALLAPGFAVDDPFAAVLPPALAELSVHFPAAAAEAADLDDSSRARGAQKRTTALREEALQRRLLEAASSAARARILSASAPFASSWLSPLPGADPAVWLSTPAFLTLLRFRFGLPLAEKAPSHCGLCSTRGAADEFGFHAVACRQRGALHNAIRDTVFELAGAALWRPRREVSIFAADPGARIDLMFAFGAGPRQEVVVADVAVVSPLVASSLAAAASSPGAAAARYEDTKVRRYGALAAAAGVTLTPLCVDIFGAWGPSALNLFRRLARAWGAQVDLHPARAVPVVMAALSSRLAAGVARLLLQGVGAHQCSSLLPPVVALSPSSSASARSAVATASG